jgi:class 3 adenylate cyclase
LRRLARCPGPGFQQSDATALRVGESTDREKLAGERKTITALFADIKGSTELIEHLDPEGARSIVDPVLRLMIEAVHRYEGYVAQSTGDGIFALFGAPLAHQDHPQRALHAALAMQQAIREHASRHASQGRPAIEARVGVSSGEVVVRTIETGGHTEYTPIGMTANLAARLQTVAAPGSIAANAEMRRLCEGYFSFRALGPTALKGIAERVEVFEVTGVGPLRTHFELASGLLAHHSRCNARAEGSELLRMGELLPRHPAAEARMDRPGAPRGEDAAVPVPADASSRPPHRHRPRGAGAMDRDTDFLFLDPPANT